ncbi:hypothetical protein JOM49_003618 [Amycolatopsis magusensis]|uniref:RNA polymerase sigma factor 70 region 4 type 2 domain-containing protein n=1 Tax=Amycolatopsis magusensis TaxID=882444 RepID=A0ABS4PRQ6_9PSEU|nr:hypothetical protein [Amycolatopsis magusensis]
MKTTCCCSSRGRGCPYEEVAAALAIPVGTVRSRLNRARRKVRAAELASPEDLAPGRDRLRAAFARARARRARA